MDWVAGTGMSSLN